MRAFNDQTLIKQISVAPMNALCKLEADKWPQPQIWTKPNESIQLFPRTRVSLGAQDNPYGGDVVNSYNDGRDPITGPVLGPVYELETSSAAAALAPGEASVHVHRTFHLTGSLAALNQLAFPALGVSSLPE